MKFLLNGILHEAEVTTEHAASSYGKPVVVMDDGQALDIFSAVSGGLEVVEATDAEIEGLIKGGYIKRGAS